MDTDLLKTFVCISECKNFTRAGAQVGRTQSAISLQIRKLEEMTGKTLLERHNRRVLLTPEGEVFLSYAKQMIGLHQDLMQRFSEPAEQGEISLGTPEDIATEYLPSILATFAKTHPKIALNVVCDFSMRLKEGFDQGAYDLILIKQEAANPHPEGVVVWEESLIWAGAEHLDIAKLKKKGPIPLVLSPTPCVYRARALTQLDQRQIPWKIVYTSPSLSGIIAAVKGGLGITILPVNMVPQGVRQIKSELLPDLNTTQIAMLHKKPLAPPAQSLRQHILDHIPRLSKKTGS